MKVGQIAEIPDGVAELWIARGVAKRAALVPLSGEEQRMVPQMPHERMRGSSRRRPTTA
jgi:hypothetical protein